jgi:microcystin-dependent protein
MSLFDESWKKETEALDLEEDISGEALTDPYDVTFVDFSGDTYEYIRRYTTLLNPSNVENGIIGKLLVNSDTASTNTSTGALIVQGGVGIEQNLNIGGDSTIAGITTITNTTNATNKDTGALVVEGGVGIEQNLYVGGNFTVSGTFISDSNTSIGSTEDSFDKDTGALVIEGGVGIEKNLNVGGNVFVTGISTFIGNVDFRGGTNGNIIFGDTSGDNVIFNADVNSNIIPNINNTYDIGSTTQRWKDGYFDGTANIGFASITNASIGVATVGTALSVSGNTFISGITTSNGGFVGTAVNGSTLELLRGNMASNDQFRILIGGSNDGGYVEFATADNGGIGSAEPIYVRQYTFDPTTPFATLNRTATLLDQFGNTGFPGIVTATTFVGNGITPLGGIIMWSGSIAEAATLEPGWALCDGRVVNGRTTPDLRNRFIVGASVENASGNYSWNSATGLTSGNYGVNNTGGEAAHQMTTTEMPRHNHRLFSSAGADPNGVIDFNKSAAQLKDTGGNGSYIIYSTTSDGEPNAYRSGWTGGDAYHENRPPYFALAFLMRTA